MAGSQFITPKSVSPSRASKRFKLAEANRSLPLVRRVVSDIVKTHEQITSLQASLEAAKHKDVGSIQTQIDRSVEQLQNYVEELHEIGCDLRIIRSAWSISWAVIAATMFVCAGSWARKRSATGMRSKR